MQRYRKHDINVKNVPPDEELLLWEEWVRIRKEEISRLGCKLRRPPVDFTMNLLYAKRQEKEWKTAMERAQIEEKPTIRGGLWEQAPRLLECKTGPNVYEIQRTAAELAEPNVLEHICVPTNIQNTELGVIGKPRRKKCLKINADFEKYRRQRQEELIEKLKKIDPCKPSCSGLIIRGGKPKTPPKKLPPIPTITEDKYISKDFIGSIYAVRINNTVLFKDIPGLNLQHLRKMKNESWHENCTTWNYYFNIPNRRAGRCKLFLQNLGTVSLKYCWKRIKRSIPYIPEDLYEQVFFFNKNEDVISPGQKKQVFFTYISENPGIHSEYWELNFSNIVFFDTLNEKININLYADCIENIVSIKKKSDILKFRIDKKATHNIVRDIIRDILYEAVTVKPQTYPYRHLFLEAELFVMKNPVCYYHQTKVGEMKRLYKEMDPDEEWDLSISTWRSVMMEKEYEDRMKYYGILKKSYYSLLKPWFEGDDLAFQKHQIVKLYFGQMADSFDKEYNKLMRIYGPDIEDDGHVRSNDNDQLELHPLVKQMVSNIFYLNAYEIIGSTIEMCSGIISSLDLNRWIEFDFCQ